MSSYRSPWMDQELEIFRDAVKKFVAAEVAPNEARWRKQQHVDMELWRKAGEMGLLCVDVPVEYGGAGADFRYEAVLHEEVWGKGFNAWGQSVHAILAQYILNHGTEAQKQKYLPRMASGELVGAIAMSEPGTGSDLQAIRTRAERQGDQYLIKGSKTFITNGYVAGLIGVVCKTHPNERAKGISIILIETKDLPGFKVGRILEKLGQKGNDTCELFFDNVPAPVENLLGDEEGLGFFQLMNDLPYERVIVAVQGVAAMEHALQLTVDYTKERQAFGKPLLEMQNTRFKLAELKAMTLVVRTFVDKCIQQVVDGELDTVTASIGKLLVSEQLCKLVDECLQFFGGYGYMMEYPIAQLYADARVHKIYGGTNEVMKEVIARSL